MRVTEEAGIKMGIKVLRVMRMGIWHHNQRGHEAEIAGESEG